MPEKTRAKIREYLDSRGIEVLTSTSLQRLVGQTAELSNGDRIENALVCWSAGMKATQEDIEGDLERTKEMRIRTNAALQLPSHPEVFVAGDAAALEKGGTLLRRAVNFSIYSGRRAGKNVARMITGKVPRPFRPADLGWVIPLSEISTGRILNTIPVGGSFGLRLHYFMCGFRHFGPSYSWEFYKTALRLSRSPGRMDL
jgi:NADH dehydrogenase